MWMLRRLQASPTSPSSILTPESPPRSEFPRLTSRSSMVPPTSPEESAAPEGQQPYRRSLPTPFLAKTYQIVDDPALDNIISWNEDGSTFIVWRPAELASEVLPKLFTHNDFMSFLRQLNSYGFRKIVSDRWEFSNELFRRGERHLLCDIRRWEVPAAAPPVTAAAVTAIPMVAPAYFAEEHVLSPNSSSGVAVPRESPRLSLSTKLIEENVKLSNEENLMLEGSENLMLEEIRLIEENEKLRSENSKLKDEIGEMKGVFDRIMMLISNYSAGQQVGEVVSAPELELMSPEMSEVVSVSAPELMSPEMSEVVSAPELELMSPEMSEVLSAPELMSPEMGEVVSAPELMSPEMGEVVSAPELELMPLELGEVVPALEPELMSPELASDEVERLAGARLFGVMIGVKRAREEAGDEMKVVVKSEAGSSEEAEAQAQSWVL